MVQVHILSVCCTFYLNVIRSSVHTIPQSNIIVAFVIIQSKPEILCFVFDLNWKYEGVVDLLDGLQLDCDQDQVIKTLIKTFQPHELPIPIDCFHNKQFEVEIWKNDRNSKQSFPLKIWIQRQKVVDVQNWNGPLIGDRERKEHHMGLVGVWSVGLDDYHAMYVTKCKKDEKGEKGQYFKFAFITYFLVRW